MDEDTRARAFEPFFTTKAARQGHRPGTLDGLRHRQAERRHVWIDSELERRNDRHDLFSGRAGRRPCDARGSAARLISDVPTLLLAPLPTPVEAMAGLSAMSSAAARACSSSATIRSASRSAATRSASCRCSVRAPRWTGADTLITAGGLQSNHARVTAATAVKLGMRAVLVVNGKPPEHATANALLDSLLGAEVMYVDSRDGRASAMRTAAERLAGAGPEGLRDSHRRVHTTRIACVLHAVLELLEQMRAPDVIVHATSSGGTQAGLVAACRLLGLSTRVVGIAADGPTSADSGAGAREHRRHRRFARSLDPAVRAARDGDRDRRSLLRRGLRDSDGSVAGGDRIDGADRSDLSRPGLHRQSDVGSDRVRPAAEVHSQDRPCSSGTPADRWACSPDSDPQPNSFPCRGLFTCKPMRGTEQETALVIQAQCGDRDAMEHVLRGVQPLKRWPLSGCIGPDVADDVLQDVLIAIARKLSWASRSPRLFRAWAYRVASRAAFAHIRRESGAGVRRRATKCWRRSSRRVQAVGRGLRELLEARCCTPAKPCRADSPLSGRHAANGEVAKPCSRSILEPSSRAWPTG